MKDKSNTESAPAVDRAFLNIIAAHRSGNKTKIIPLLGKP